MPAEISGKGSTLKTDYNYNKTALIIGAFLILLCLSSLLYLALPPKEGGEYIAEIFQNGTLHYSIPLSGAQEGQSLRLETENGGFNEIEISADGIRIRSASCPDKLCVRQGFLQDSGLPMVCLPTRLVIRLRPADAGESAGIPDAVTY